MLKGYTPVLDPEIPEPDKSELIDALAQSHSLTRSSAPRRPTPRLVPSDAAITTEYAACLFFILILVAVTVRFISQVALRDFIIARQLTGAVGAVFYILLGLMVIALLTSIGGAVTASSSGWTKTVDPGLPRTVDDPEKSFRGRYVMPIWHMDDEARSVWARVISAHRTISRSEVIAGQLIDSVQVSVIMPYFLWDVARYLADLSAMRDRQSAILADVDEEHPDVAAVLDPQRRVQARHAAMVEKRVRSLETFAELVTEADVVVRRGAAVRQLARLNDVHLTMLAEDRPGEDDLGPSGQLSQDVNTVIRQVNEAIRRANEAGSGLILPGEQAS